MDIYQAEKVMQQCLQNMYRIGQNHAKEAFADGTLEHQKEVFDQVFGDFPEACRGFWDMCRALDMVYFSFPVKEK